MRNDIRNGLLSKCGCVVLGALLLISQIALADIIPSSRLANWTLAGVPGGIPTRTNIFVNVLTTSNPRYQCLTTAGDISVPLHNAIYDCPSNMVVYIPTGVYTLTNKVYLNGFSSTGNFCTVRGDGPGNTIIVSKILGAIGNGVFDFENVYIPTNNIWNIVGSNPIGASNITVSSFGSGTPVVGNILWIDQLNDYIGTSCAGTDIQGNGTTCTIYDTNDWLQYTATETNFPPGAVVMSLDNAGNPEDTGDRVTVAALPDEPRGSRGCQQLVRLTAVNGNTISFWPPLFYEFDQTKQARVACEGNTPFHLVGFENLTVSNATTPSVVGGVTNNPNTLDYLVYISNADRCWIYNVEIDNLKKWGLVLQQSVQCQVDHCYIHNGINQGAPGKPQIWPTLGKDGYGFQLNESSSFLFQNNILTHLFIPIMVEEGSSGNVIAYNLSLDNLNGPDTNSLMSAIQASHCEYAAMNLYEGNAVTAFETDSNAGYNTVFRNWLWGTDIGPNYGPSINGNRHAVRLDHFSYYFNVVGNILGVTNGNIAWVYSETNSGASSPDIWQLGYPNMGNTFLGSTGYGGCCSTYPGGNNGSGGCTSTACTNAFWAQLDTNVLATLLRADNFDYANSNIADRVSGMLTNSYYLSGKPSWWGSTLPWPPFDPSHPELASITNIPAGYRYVTGVDMPNKSSPLHFYLIVQ